ncbi:DUF6011 domain-containing protein [Nonomuraea wenchangensis]|uniref:DUF6011 domain-containing protein n=1 Tax=Nonomuraea wenchangensis TaxID=568860 RepID=UPI00332638AE
MNLLDLDEPGPHDSEGHAEGSTRCICRRTLTDPVSVAYGMGPDCRRKRGIVPPQRVRITGVPSWRDCEGQQDLTDLLETPDDE